MANVAVVVETRQNRRYSPPSARRTGAPPQVRSAAIPVSGEPAASGMHPGAFRLPMIAAAWFLISMAISFADTLETAYLMAIVSDSPSSSSA